MLVLKLVPEDMLIDLRKFFKGDDEKVKLWLETKNLNFGGCAPIDLINRGRAHKVREFIDDAKGGWV